MGADGALAGRGAQVQPVPAAPLYSNRFWTGLWTQANPMRDAATQYLLETFYSASRFERMIGGQNIEITPRLTPARRPGNSIYNTANIPSVNRFFEFRSFSAGSESIRLLASVDSGGGSIGGGTVRDLTGPTNNLTLWNKNASAVKTFFQSIGNTCFFADGVDAKKYLLSGKKWQASATYTVGDYIVDTTGNLQVFSAQKTVLNIADTEVRSVTMGNSTQTFLIVTLSAPIASPIPALQPVTFAGLTTKTALNGVTLAYQNIAPGWNLNLSTSQIAFAYTATPWTPTSDTGTATTYCQADTNGNPLTGTSGGTQPTWPTTPLLTQTQDNQVTWTLFGPTVQDWAVAAPKTAPSVVSGPSVSRWYPGLNLSSYAANTYVVLDPNGNIQVMSSAGGTTGTQPPQWNSSLGSITKDGPAVQWINYGTPSSWLANFSYTQQYVCIVDTNGNLQIAKGVPPGPVQSISIQNTGSGYAAGNQGSILGTGTGATYIVNTVAVGGGATSVSLGSVGFGYNTGLLATAPLTGSGGGLTLGVVAGTSTGLNQPTWNATVGGTTNDGQYIWTNAGPAIELASGTQQYAYSYHSIDGSVTTASPVFKALYGALGAAGGLCNKVTVLGTTAAQIDQIWIWRTPQGQSTLILLDIIPNPGTATPVEYDDVIPDTSTTGQQALNPFITAPIAESNNPPIAGFVPLAYHVGRIFGYSVNAPNVLQFSGGPGTVTGNGNTAFPPANQFTLPSFITGAWSTALGLIVMRIDGFSVVLGNGTANSPLYTIDIFDNVGVPSQDAFATRGNTLYAMTTTGKVIKLTTAQFVSAVQGELTQGLEDFEIGFPIGDLLSTNYDPTQAFVVWHEGPSEDSGLFVCDGATGWYNMKQLTQPEQCNPWSPKALLTGGCSAIASIETQPGIRTLLIGPNGIPTPGMILKRDLTTSQDNGQNYPAYMQFGSIVLAQPGTEADIQFIVTETTNAGSRPAVGILTDEINGAFTNLINIRKRDPVNLLPSQTAPATRFWAMQSGKPITCRHLQVQITWPAENFANELLTYTIYGRLPEKSRK